MATHSAGISRRDVLRLGAAAALGPGFARAADPDDDPPDLLIGYSEFRTDLPGGRYVNEATRRAVVVKADGTGRRTLAEELSHAYSLAFALHYVAMLYLYRREACVALEWAEAAMALSRQHGMAQWLTGGMFMRGWALAEQGAIEEGIVQLQQAQAAWQALGTGLGQAHLAVRLAEAYGKGGQAEVGLRVLAQALDTVHSNAEHYYEAELYRVKGELLLRQAADREMVRTVSAEAEACFQQAFDVARQQRATSLQLRALLSLSRLWQQQGQQAAAHRLLAETYGWFTEGFDTRDLQEAQALLEGLA